MVCLTGTATIKNKITAASVIKAKLVASATVLNSGISAALCPIILCVDGGASTTVSYPSVNGLLNGGAS